MLGIVDVKKALEEAKLVELDLVEISPNADPPVCKILDFGKFKYEAKKRQHEAKKKQKITILKEIKFKPNIGPGDFDVKVKKIKECIADGDKVKITLWFKGREIMHNEIGMKLFAKIIETLRESIIVEVEPKLEGKQIIMLLAPKV